MPSRHVKMLGGGKFLSVGGEFVVQQVVELLWARPSVVSVAGVRVVEIGTKIGTNTVVRATIEVSQSVSQSVNQSINRSYLFAQVFQHKYSHEAIQYERDNKTSAVLIVVLKLAYVWR